MDTKAITIRAEVGTIDDIDALAKAMDRSRNYVVNQAMISYVAKSMTGARAAPQRTAAAPEAAAKPKKKGKKKKKKAGKKSKK